MSGETVKIVDRGHYCVHVTVTIAVVRGVRCRVRAGVCVGRRVRVRGDGNCWGGRVRKGGCGGKSGNSVPVTFAMPIRESRVVGIGWCWVRRNVEDRAFLAFKDGGSVRVLRRQIVRGCEGQPRQRGVRDFRENRVIVV